MTLKLYGHPLSSFCWKTFIALHERDTPFDLMMLDAGQPQNIDAVARFSPTGQFPVLVHADRVVIESAAIIEYLDLHCGDAAPMVPRDPHDAIEARQMDGVFDDYVMAPVQRMTANVLREESKRDPHVEGEVRATLDKSYAWLDRWMTGRTWAALDTFGIADCAAAPALFYAHWAFPIPERHAALRDYRRRLLERPSIARVIADAGPWLQSFPLRDRGSPE